MGRNDPRTLPEAIAQAVRHIDSAATAYAAGRRELVSLDLYLAAGAVAHALYLAGVERNA